LNGITAEIQLKPYKRNMFTFARYRLENNSEARNRLIAYKIDVGQFSMISIYKLLNFQIVSGFIFLTDKCVSYVHISALTYKYVNYSAVN
jgi:hypothetical protein